MTPTHPHTLTHCTKRPQPTPHPPRPPVCTRQVLEYERQQDIQFLAKRRRNYMGSSYLPAHTGSMAGWQQARGPPGQCVRCMVERGGHACCVNPTWLLQS